ncbi:Protein of unknown function [Evansella caseinilytica]|uniref:DUF3888 domain-containing protein n=1 Tax=Evansella caseinilytica TaxID=1503961 RepID=A0A1H3V0U9_9BACI|nr:DUF3888 domain-containing protein [Evansella caseinilytica]SDZ68198.1 Protein of unknown function [Evansella caseinilytica]
MENNLIDEWRAMDMKKVTMTSLLVFLIYLHFCIPVFAGSDDLQEVLYHDVIVTLLMPEIIEEINGYYETIFTQPPAVYPYMITVEEMKRMEEGRSFLFLISLHVTPVVGPHIGVGEDHIVFKLSGGGQKKVVKYEHLKNYELPDRWKKIRKKPAQ